MSKLTNEEKVRRYHSIYDQIYLNPRIHVHEISKNLRLPRNTVASYLDSMYELEMLFGPELRLKYYQGLNEYMYLVKFDDPYAAFDELQQDTKIIYCSMFLGDWNMMIMSDRDYDPSYITGFEYLLYKGERRDTVTPKVALRDWKPAFQRMKIQASEFDPNGAQESNLVSCGPPAWDDEEWKLFYEYKYDFRKKVTPVLRRNLISSDKFYHWIKDLHNHVDVNLRFYPDGYGNYTHFGFLFRTKYPKAVISLLSNLPTSPSCIEVEDGAIALLGIKSDLTFAELSVTTHRMKLSSMIDRFSQAIGVLHYIEAEEGYTKLQ